MPPDLPENDAAASTDAVSDCIASMHDIVTTFGTRRVHSGVSLEVERGSVTAIVGGSGSGKSTLMRELVMLQPPDSGSIRLFGQEVVGMDELATLPLRRRIGVLFQHGALFGDMSVLENVMVPLREHSQLSLSLVEELAMLKIRMAGLGPEAAALYPAQLSGGMRKRAAAARALALDPELLALDEPSSGLDPVSADSLDELILQLKSLLGLTIVLVTHDMDSLRAIADQIYLLGDGRILGSGTMDALAANEDPAVQAFFAGPRGRSRHGDTGG